MFASVCVEQPALSGEKNEVGSGWPASFFDVSGLLGPFSFEDAYTVFDHPFKHEGFSPGSQETLCG